MNVKLQPVFYDDNPEMFTTLRDHRFPPDQPLYAVTPPPAVAILASGLTLRNGRAEAYFDRRPVGSEVGSAESVQPVYSHPVYGEYTWFVGPTLVR